MDAIECLKKRRSIRDYEEKEIPKEVLKEIINCARFAPTARNEQPWEFIVITEKETLKKMGDMAPNGSFIKDSVACIAVFCKDTKYYLEDGSAATTYILLVAHALGIGSCWVAGDKKPYCGEIKNMLNVPKDYKLVSLVSLGYSTENVKEKRKRDVKGVIHWERF